jgi:hypothetical protein
MLQVIQRFGKHRSCHLQGEYILVGRFWRPYIGQAVGGQWDVTNMIVGAEERAAIQLVMVTTKSLGRKLPCCYWLDEWIGGSRNR